MNTNFELSLKYVLVDEGGNDDDPQDHGGRTSRGITQREYDTRYSGDVWQATAEQIKDLYKTQYWDPYCDDLPSGVDYVFFDTAVNAGRSRAVKSFQQALGITADGMMGIITLDAIKKADPEALIKKVCDVRRNFYRNLAQFPRYGRGWLSRVDHCEKGAKALASNTSYHREATESPKANETDVARTMVTPETSGGTAVATGGLMSYLDNFKAELAPYVGDISYLKYVLIAVATTALGYSVYGFWQRNQVQKVIN